jgi:hypothetical protein
MEFNLDFLRTAGEALSSFGKKDKDKDDDRFDTEVNDQTTEKDTTEIIKTKTEEKEKKEDTEDDLEKKLKNIEKVIDTFSGGDVKQLPSSTDLVGTSSDNINIKAPDLSSLQAKANMQEYLKPSNRQDDRIALLYEDLKKYNLI